MGAEPQQGLRLGWVRVLLAARPSAKNHPGTRAAVPGEACRLPAPPWAPWCDAVSVHSIQRYLSFPFVNYV